VNLHCIVLHSVLCSQNVLNVYATVLRKITDAGIFVLFSSVEKLKVYQQSCFQGIHRLCKYLNDVKAGRLKM